jgi:N6-L-threonylcarbamoyladenine synthase
MDGEIEFARDQHLFQFGGEKPLAADFGERPIGDPVSLGGENHDFEIVCGKAMRGNEAIARFIGLSQSERASARTDSESFCLHSPQSVVLGFQVIIFPAHRNQAKGPIVPVLRILGLETSCDETAASIVERDENGEGRILADVVLSQLDEHSVYGGVVPEIAARAHVEALDGLIVEALHRSSMRLSDVDAIAATSGPGLIGGLLVGLMTGKAIAMATAKPLYAINHLEGHALTARLTHGLAFPYLLLLVSGGHTQLILVKGVGDYERWGTTIDDALGEAFDKTAKLLGLPYPGGPAVERAARSGNAERFAFPRPMVGEARLDFSFSGLKTAVRQAAEAIAPVSEQDIADICASFQNAVSRTMKDRISRGLARFHERFGTSVERPTLVVAGGVAANAEIRSTLETICATNRFAFIAPPMALCTDNAAMIAWAGLERLALGLPSDSLDVAPRSRWPLDENAATLLGSGKRGAKA